MAILVALRSPELEVLGLTTTFGNVHTALATRNALHLVRRLSFFPPRPPRLFICLPANLFSLDGITSSWLVLRFSWRPLAGPTSPSRRDPM